MIVYIFSLSIPGFTVNLVMLWKNVFLNVMFCKQKPFLSYKIYTVYFDLSSKILSALQMYWFLAWKNTSH